MKRKLLNALRARLGYRGYTIGAVSQPFNESLCVAIKRPDGAIQTVYVNQDNTDYDSIANVISEYTEMSIVINVEGTPDG